MRWAAGRRWQGLSQELSLGAPKGSREPVREIGDMEEGRPDHRTSAALGTQKGHCESCCSEVTEQTGCGTHTGARRGTRFRSPRGVKIESNRLWFPIVYSSFWLLGCTEDLTEEPNGMMHWKISLGNAWAVMQSHFLSPPGFWWLFKTCYFVPADLSDPHHPSASAAACQAVGLQVCTTMPSLQLTV